MQSVGKFVTKAHPVSGSSVHLSEVRPRRVSVCSCERLPGDPVGESGARHCYTHVLLCRHSCGEVEVAVGRQELSGAEGRDLENPGPLVVSVARGFPNVCAPGLQRGRPSVLRKECNDTHCWELSQE